MLSQTKLRRDPHRKGKRIPTSNGFTVIELMLVLVVVGGIVALALPSYSTVLEKRQVTSAAQQLSAFLSAAQLEAVKRNEYIAVDLLWTDSDTWCLGMVVVDKINSTTNDPCDCTAAESAGDACKIDGQLRVLTDANLNYPDIMDAMQGDPAFVYDPVRGLLVDHTDAVTLELLSRTGKYALDVQFSATGRLRICSHNSSTKVPGYDEC